MLIIFAVECLTILRLVMCQNGEEIVSADWSQFPWPESSQTSAQRMQNAENLCAGMLGDIVACRESERGRDCFGRLESASLLIHSLEAEDSVRILSDQRTGDTKY